MSRFRSILSAVLTAASAAALTACGTSVAPTPGFGVPAVIKLTPTPTASVDLGSTLQFSASALNGTRAPLTTTFSYSSTNPAVVSIASNGLACAGTWDSVTTPVVCTPGGVGQATITASSNGVVSAPTIVYVHQHIAQISVSPIAANGGPPTGPGGCYTSAAGSLITAQAQSYQASALSDDAAGQPTVDVTSSVGPFSWSTSQPAVATLTPLNALGIPNGQVRADAHTPGMTQISAFIANSTSAPLPFTTCPVQSIALSVNPTGGTIINAAKGTSAGVSATVTDTAGNQISPTLTWSSSNTAVATVSSSGVISSPGVGGATITASCIAPTCNINLSPPQPIYPATPIGATYTGTTSTPFSVYVSSSNPSCAANLRCTAFLVPISGSPPLAGTGTQLPSVATSVDFAPGGATAYLGSQKGLMTAAVSSNPPTITVSPSVTGSVLAVSPDDRKVIVSDTLSPVKQIFIFDTASRTSTSLVISAPNTIAARTRATFSPDSLKAFILAATTDQNNLLTTTLYVYSTQFALQAVALSTGAPAPAPLMDVAFLANGMFGYLALGNSPTSYLATCDNPGQTLSSQLGTVAATTSFLRPLPDGSGLIGLAPPNLIVIKSIINGLPLGPGLPGCPIPFPQAALSVSNSVSAVPLSATPFTPVAFILSSDGQKVYLVIQSSPAIIVYDLIRQLPPTSLALVGNPTPLAAALSPDGQTLYVSADDGKLHFVNTVSGGDAYQLAVPSASLCTIASGGQQPSCLPDLIAVRP
ncbi:MAG: hypothetical protein JO249_14945 [Acidobacteria bacterium]|nr:hypothetical protein [Acidobacteriota bacterium]